MNIRTLSLRLLSISGKHQIFRQIITTSSCQQNLELCNHRRNTILHKNSINMNGNSNFIVSNSKNINNKKNMNEIINCEAKRYTTALSNMTKDQANELVFRLTDQERQVLLQVLNQFDSNKERKKLEGNVFKHFLVVYE